MAFAFKHGDRPLEGYTIQRGVGRGGFGEVYYAVSDGGKDVALKYLRDNPEVELRGVEACINLKNPHLVSVYDVRKNDAGEYFIIMEYISGPSLRDLLVAEPRGLGVPKAAYFLKGIGAGLAYLHDRGIVHRDLKPGNIFYDDGYVKIGDYGLSKFISLSRHSAHTSSVGTVHYMAPEVGSGHYTKAIDIYAVGVMLYEMLLGRLPFEGSSMGEVLMKHLTQRPELDGLQEPFAQVIRKALEKAPEDRFQTMEDMLAAVFGAAGVRDDLSSFNPELSLSGAAARGTADVHPSPVHFPNGAGRAADRAPHGPPPPPPPRALNVPPAPAAAYVAAVPKAKPLAPEVVAGRVRYAGFWIRFAAAIIDLIVLGIPLSIAWGIAPVVGPTAVGILYDTLLLSRWQGQTIGKRACGIRVINADGTMCDTGDAFRRTLASIVTFLTTPFFGFGYLMAAFDDRKRALHDRIAGTLHIYADEPAPSPPQRSSGVSPDDIAGVRHGPTPSSRRSASVIQSFAVGTARRYATGAFRKIAVALGVITTISLTSGVVDELRTLNSFGVTALANGYTATTELFILSGLAALVSVILSAVLLYRCWAQIQDSSPRTSPGKACGLMFVPFFNCYWVYVAVAGLATDLARYLKNRAIPGRTPDTGLARSACTWFVVSIVSALVVLAGNQLFTRGSLSPTAWSIVKFWSTLADIMGAYLWVRVAWDLALCSELVSASVSDCVERTVVESPAAPLQPARHAAGRWYDDLLRFALIGAVLILARACNARQSEGAAIRLKPGGSGVRG